MPAPISTAKIRSCRKTITSFKMNARKIREHTAVSYTHLDVYKRQLQKIVDELKEEKLVVEKEDLLEITEKGRHVYTNLGASLRSFSVFWDLCIDIMERYQGDAKKIKERVFHHITFRRAKIGEHIFDYCWY